MTIHLSETSYGVKVAVFIGASGTLRVMRVDHADVAGTLDVQEPAQIYGYDVELGEVASVMDTDDTLHVVVAPKLAGHPIMYNTLRVVGVKAIWGVWESFSAGASLMPIEDMDLAINNSEPLLLYTEPIQRVQRRDSY